MKKAFLLPCLFILATFCSMLTAAPNAPKPVEKEAIEKSKVVSAQEEWENLSKKEKRTKRKEMRKDLKKALKTAKKQQASDIDLTLLVILAILIPPLAMGLYDGITKRFWISLLLTLLFFVPGLIYTLVVILREN